MPTLLELQVYYRVDEDSSEYSEGVSANEKAVHVDVEQKSPAADVVAEQVSAERTSHEEEPGSTEEEDVEDEEVEEATSDEKEPQMIP